MSLSLTLNNALSGLNVSQQSLKVLSQNIANANTPGYSRQIITQQPIYIDGEGQGVSIEAITRQVDAYLNKAVQLQSSDVGKANVIDDYNTRIQLLMGTPGGQNSMDVYVSNFFNALQGLSQTPQDSTLQLIAVNNGVTLATQMQSLAEGLQNLQFEADRDIGNSMTVINTDLRNLAQLNVNIVNNIALGKSVAGLQDQRDKLINDISQYMNIQTFIRDSGAINISTGNGISILDDNIYQLSYTPAGSASSFSDGTALSPLSVYRTDTNGNLTGIPTELITSGVPSDVVSRFSSGKVAGLKQLRDQDIPNIIDQLNLFAATLRDQINVIHNQGTGFPGANSFTGTRLVGAQDYSEWDGHVRIAVLDQNGQPIASPYADEPNGVVPLTIDLSALDTGRGAGTPSIQGIIDTINDYYGVPRAKAEVGNLNNIQLVSDSNTIPASSSFSFDFDLNNIASDGSKFFVTNVAVTDNLGASMTPVNNTIPSVALDPVNTYVTTAGSSTVTINTTASHGFTNGQVIYLSTPSSPSTVDGIPASQLGGFFTISNATNTGFDIQVVTDATAGATTASVGQTVSPPYQEVDAGEKVRTASNGLFTVGLTNNLTAPYYDIAVNVAVADEQGNLKTSMITYRINNQQSNLLNAHVSAMAISGQGSLVGPQTNQPIAVAKLVDADGNELPKVNGKYSTLSQGYLKIEASSGTNVIAIDSLDSVEQGQPNNSPVVAGSGRGFSYYFDLNDFFSSNELTNTGDTVAGSAFNLQVEQRLRDNNSLIALGTLVSSPRSADTDAPAYTYERNRADNGIVQRLAQLNTTLITFASAGQLGVSTQSFGGYVGQIIGAAATNSATARSTKGTADMLLEGYTQQASSISGVNLDTELANTVIYQNAYAASARIITITGQLFDTLLNTFQ